MKGYKPAVGAVTAGCCVCTPALSTGLDMRQGLTHPEAAAGAIFVLTTCLSPLDHKLHEGEDFAWPVLCSAPRTEHRVWHF